MIPGTQEAPPACAYFGVEVLEKGADLLAVPFIPAEISVKDTGSEGAFTIIPIAPSIHGIVF